MVEIQNDYKGTIARKALYFFSCVLFASFAWTGAAQGSLLNSLQQQAYLKASNTGVEDVFGFSVAISGDPLVIGAPGEGSGATVVNGYRSNNSGDGSGAVYVFTRSGASWSQQAYLEASNTDASVFAVSCPKSWWDGLRHIRGFQEIWCLNGLYSARTTSFLT